MEDKIIVRGAREHNLKNVSITVPRDQLVVFTGLSGSGKSSLAFDTIYAEGQRRYVESMSSYGCEFARLPYAYFLPVLKDESFQFLEEEPMPTGFGMGDIIL